ncbi:MAG: hypothetical protein AB1394_16360, partial [Bacteroidota bacterium]
LTSEALYAGMTHEQTRQAKIIDLSNDGYNFGATYKIEEFPIWFTPGLFVDRNMETLSKYDNAIDTNIFNVLDEDYPGTGAGKSRKFCPTYGTIESVLPDQRLLTSVFAQEKILLEKFSSGKVYLLGKKRTMFQIVDVSEIEPCSCITGGKIWACQVSPMIISQFTEYTIYAATRRYLLISGCYSGHVFQAVFKNYSQVAYPEELIPIIKN